MKFKFYLNKISTYAALPIVLTFSIINLIAIFSNLNSKTLIAITIILLIVISLINFAMNKYVFKNDKNPVLLNILLCVACALISLYTSFIYINRFPIKITYTQQEILEVKNYYSKLSVQLYPFYQLQIPQSMKDMEEIVLKEFGSPKVTITYLNNPSSHLAGFVFMLNKNNIYINTPEKDSIQNNTMALAHELCHTKGVVNEAYTEFMACKILMNSSNQYLNFIGSRFIIYFLSGEEHSYYDCTQLIVQDYYLNLKG